jgi:glycosyltransferase involved in cell wall biosynthesis
MKMTQRKKRRVLFLCGTMSVGGTEKNVVTIAKQLDRDRFEPEVYCVYGGGPLEEQLRLNNIPYEVGSPGRIFEPKVFRRAYRFIRKGDYDIVHCFGYPVIYLGTLLGAVQGIKVIVSIQALDTWKRSMDVLTDKALKPFVDLYIADSEGARRFAMEQQGLLPERIMTIYDGVDTASLVPAADVRALKKDFGIDPSAAVVGVVARLQDEHKGQSYFIKAIPSVLKEFPQTHFLIVGDGADRELLESLVDTTRVREHVTFTGTRTDLANMFSIIDILVLPSVQWESITKTMLEAMAMSRPIIATKVGDVGEILSDGATGLLIPPGEPGEISKAVTYLLGNPERAGELGRRGRELILERNLTLEKSVRIVEGAYEKVLSADKRGGVMAKVRAGLLFIMFSLLSLTYSLYTSLANSFRSPKSGDNT